MNLHKSIGLLVGGLMVPRIFTRIISKKPEQPTLKVLRVLSRLSHYGMYTIVSLLVISGVSIGYHSGYGVPFFGYYTVPGLPQDQINSDFAGYSYKMHKYLGVTLEYLIAAHVAGFMLHFLTGHNLLTRLSGPVGTTLMALPWISLVGAVAYTTQPDKLPEFKNWMSPPTAGPLEKKTEQ